MDATTSTSDVLHSENHSKLSPEEIAKAVARHNHHHPTQQAQAAKAKTEKKRH